MFESQLIVKLLQAIRGWGGVGYFYYESDHVDKAKKFRRAFDMNRRRYRQRCEP